MLERVKNALDKALYDWGMMQKTTGDEGAEWAEIFERDFYLFIDSFEAWFQQVTPKPQSIEAAEKLPEIQNIQQILPGPLQLNFEMELERIIDGQTDYRYD
ncbi:hypothetical protein [Ferdinandcohnia sp. Marseille-Q9671]